MKEPLTGRALDAAVHLALGNTIEHVWTPNRCQWCFKEDCKNVQQSCRGCGTMKEHPAEPIACNAPHYSADYNAVRAVLGYVAENGLDGEFVAALDYEINSHCRSIPAVCWSILNASAEQLCRAFLEVVKQ